MKRRHASLDNYMCHQTDVLNLPFPEDSFDAVVDKGTLDALLCRNMEDAQAMATEMHRVLTKGGVFVQVWWGGGGGVSAALPFRRLFRIESDNGLRSSLLFLPGLIVIVESVVTGRASISVGSKSILSIFS